MKIRVHHIMVVILTAMLVGGCSAYRAHYDIGLVKTERPDAAKEQYGIQDITKMEEQGPDKSIFEDGMVRIIWTPTAFGISFDLTNKTSHSLEIMWDDARFIDENGERLRIVLSGSNYESMNDPLPPAVIEGGGSMTDMVFPKQNINFVDAGWKKTPLFPSYCVPGRADELQKQGEACIGKTFQVLLPLEINGTLNQYVFTFEVAGVEVRK